MSQAGVIFTSDPCETTTTLPEITVTAGSGSGGSGYSHHYTKVYNELCSEGLRAKTYTISHACNDIVCREPLVETAPPPGFTCAAVACSACHSGGPRTETLTIPIESIKAYSASGYIVKATESPQQGAEDSCRGDCLKPPAPTAAPVAPAAPTGDIKAPSEKAPTGKTPTNQGHGAYQPNGAAQQPPVSGSSAETPSGNNAAANAGGGGGGGGKAAGGESPA